ncbi:hypothetical protein OSC27_01920 [Microbacterium sp. STN6]|uniref:hypothetical protein n=1 Tax=Microbacterium sp. STN6 TaxID=2995588 RepID=UPI002260DC98|nr:hypothetical protein [Microbacterium sp. STN6]MCX7521029.1 hypothetical protein [Microbacterium sp. STN6]
MPAAAGVRQVCLYIIDSGKDVKQGCLPVVVVAPDAAPTGVWEKATGIDQITVSGWAVYPGDLGKAVKVSVDVDGKRTTATADEASPGVGAKYPGAGDNHGYSINIPASAGTHTVCLYLAYVSTGEARQGCLVQHVVTADSPPTGVWEKSSGTNGVTVSGWAVYPGALTKPVAVMVTIDGVRHSLIAGGSSPGINSRFPGAGDSHGYSGTFPSTVGSHEVCVYLTTLDGVDIRQGCLTQKVSAPILPAGVWQRSSGAGGVTVSGWAVYPDAKTTTVKGVVTVDGVAHSFTADQNSAGVDLQYPGAGDGHGYSTTVSATAGDHEVCLYLFDRTGNRVRQGCLTQLVVAVDAPPAGVWSSVSGAGGISVAGWALYPGALTTTVPITVSIDGVRTTISANGDFAGTDAKYPGAGDNHGFSVSLPASSGSHNVCVFFSRNGGGEIQWGCTTVAVILPNSPPVGTWLSSTGFGGVTISGWALFPGALTETVSMAVQVDSSWYPLAANQYWSGTNKLYPGAGDNHGYSGTVPATPGDHEVCVYANNRDSGSTQLGCLTQNVVPAAAGTWATSDGSNGNVTVSGWALYPDKPTATADISVEIDGAAQSFPAAQPSPGVGTIFPGAGDSHGYAVAIPAAAGTHQVCVYVLGPGTTKTRLGCLSQAVTP